MIRLQRLTKRYGKFTAVDGIDLDVPRGELFGLLGPNGAGKTTSIRMIAGILRPTSGTVTIGGIDIQARPLEAKARLGYIPDRPFVYDKLTGGEFLRFAAALYGLQGPVVERRIDELLAMFELAPWKGELTETYSHGMRQKLIIAGALVHRPEVIVVDEPMVGLDPKSARLLKELFREFVSRGGTVLMSTHTMEIAEVMCDRIAIVYRGKIAAQGTMDELRQQTSSEGMSLEDLFLKLTGGHQHRPAGHRARRVTAPRADPAGPVDDPHPQVAGRARARAPGAEVPGEVRSCWQSPASASGPRSSGSRTGCCATSRTCRTSGACSPARCSASSCSRSCRSCCSRTSSRRSRPSSSPRISTSWSRRRSGGSACTSPSWARPSSTRRGWWGCWRSRSSPPTAWCSPAGRSSRSWRSPRWCPISCSRPSPARSSPCCW